VEFIVLDIEPSGPVRGRFVLADAQVARAGAFVSHGEEDMESEGTIAKMFHTRTHLGAILQPGDTALGYHLSSANYNSDEFTELSPDRIPDVILVKKTYPARRKKSKARAWRLKTMAKEIEEDETIERKGIVGKQGGRDQKKVDQDYELFLRDIEEDAEMRAAVNLFKVAGAGSGLAGGKNHAIRRARKAAQASTNSMDMDEEVYVALIYPSICEN
jgi:nonsense-mediated mRNA decay protein 3